MCHRKQSEICKWAERGGGGELLNALRLAVGANKRIEDGQHVAPIIHHTFKNIFQLRVALGFTVPFGQYRAGNFDVSPQLIGRMAAQKQAVEKRGLALRILKILQRIGGNDLWQRGHREKCSLPKSVSASSRTYVLLTRCSQPSRFGGFGHGTTRNSRAQYHCPTSLNALRC